MATSLTSILVYFFPKLSSKFSKTSLGRANKLDLCVLFTLYIKNKDLVGVCVCKCVCVVKQSFSICGPVVDHVWG